MFHFCFQLRNDLPELTRHRVETIFDEISEEDGDGDDDVVLSLTKRESQRRQQQNRLGVGQPQPPALTASGFKVRQR